jgi:hypothetical protein
MLAANKPAQILFVGGCLVVGASSVEFLTEASRDGHPVITVFARRRRHGHRARRGWSVLSRRSPVSSPRVP